MRVGGSCGGRRGAGGRAGHSVALSSAAEAGSALRVSVWTCVCVYV